MTEEELRVLLDNSFKENVNPIIKQMTDLIGNAYEAGFNIGMKVGKLLKD